MKKTIGTRMKKFQSMCCNMARLQTNYVKFYVSAGDENTAYSYARDAASWVFKAYPEMREP